MNTATVEIQFDSEFTEIEDFAKRMGMEQLTQIKGPISIYMYGNSCQVEFKCATKISVSIWREDYLDKAVSLIAEFLRIQRGKITKMSAEFTPYFNLDGLNEEKIQLNTPSSEIISLLSKKYASHAKHLAENTSYKEFKEVNLFIASFKDYAYVDTLNSKHVIREIKVSNHEVLMLFAALRLICQFQVLLPQVL